MLAADISIPFLLSLLYAETHYRFPFFPFSRYFRRTPEILADAPSRVEPGESLPILLLVKDSHRFPIFLNHASIEITDTKGARLTRHVSLKQLVAAPWWSAIIQVDTETLSGSCHIAVTFRYRIGGRERSCVNHNVPTTPSFPLVVHLAESPLPGKTDGWRWGDLHYHSSYTEDFVEYGAPIDSTRAAARALGLAFVAITDHSYDLDDCHGSWERSDPELTRWHESRAFIRTLSEGGIPVLLAGEEVSSTTAAGRNVHALLLNEPEFFPGSGDGAERWFHTRCEMTLADINARKSQDALFLAAHPRMPFTFLERLLLRRGQWEQPDIALDRLTGLQILNGAFGPDFHDGLLLWKGELLRGRRLFLFAGNDAHGNFNRFHQVHLPMISTWTKSTQILGQCRTGAIVDGDVTVVSVLEALRRGRSVISNGPLLELEVVTNGVTARIGGAVNASSFTLRFRAASSGEWGKIESIRLWLGIVGKKEERSLNRDGVGGDPFLARSEISIDVPGGSGYVRGEVICRRMDESETRCYTNPIWFGPEGSR